MRPSILAAVLVPALALPVAAAPKYFLRDIATLDDCRGDYATLAGDWAHHPWFMRTALSGGREHVLNCLPDGVEEFMCNPASRKMVVVVAPGQTEAACHAYTPRLPLRRAMLPR